MMRLHSVLWRLVIARRALAGGFSQSGETGADFRSGPGWRFFRFFRRTESRVPPFEAFSAEKALHALKRQETVFQAEAAAEAQRDPHGSTASALQRKADSFAEDVARFQDQVEKRRLNDGEDR